MIFAICYLAKDLTIKFTAKDGVAVFKIDTPGSKVLMNLV